MKRPRIALVVLCLLVGSPLLRSADERVNVSAVLWNGHLVVLEDNGGFAAWTLPDCKSDQEWAGRLELSGAKAIVAVGDTFWAATDTALFKRDQESDWRDSAKLHPEKDSPILALLVVGGIPLVVYHGSIAAPLENKVFPVPTLEGQITTNSLRLQVAFATKTHAFFGTGHGEWGGNLLSLNPSTGEWSQIADGLHYVTGITSPSGDHVVVSWSMSHFTAHTVIRSHDRFTKVIKGWPMLEERYYQRIAYSAYDRELYGIENRTFVRIRSGIPEPIVELPGNVFEGEPFAIGVAPGIRVVIPIDASLVVVVPSIGSPLRVNTRKASVEALE